MLYGGGATGGTINIITKSAQPGSESTSFGASAGTYGTREVRVGTSTPGTGTGFTLFANDYASDGYRRNNRVEQQNLEGEARAFEKGSSLAFKFGFDSQELRLPGARTAAELQTDPRGTATPGDFSTRDGRRASLAGGRDLGFGEFAAELGYRQTARTSLLKDYSGFVIDTYTDTLSRVWSFTPRLKIPYAAAGSRHSLVAGFDLDDWDYQSRRAASQQTLDNPTARVLAAQRDAAFYAQQHSQLGEGTKLTLGARWQRVTVTARDTVNPAAYASQTKTSTPRAWEVGLRQDLGVATSVYGRVGESFRVATIDEVYSQFGGPACVGFVCDSIVTLLEPQTSRDYELGAEYRGGAVRVRASAFAMLLENEIYFFAPTFSNVNLPPTRRRGLEIDASAAVSPSISLFANASVTDARFRDGMIGGVDVSGNSIPLVPRRKGNAGVSWQIAQGSRLSAVARYVGEQYYDNDQINTFPSRMPAYTVVDLKFSQVVGGLTLGAAVNNLLNEHYYSYAIRNFAGTSFNAYPQRERNFLLTAEYRL